MTPEEIEFALNDEESWFWSYLEYFNKPKPKGKHYNFSLFCYNLMRENNKK